MVVDVLLKNVSTDPHSSGVGAVVHVQHLPKTLLDLLERRGKQAFGHAVRRHFTSQLTKNTNGYLRLDVGLLGTPPHRVSKCLILIHTGHPPRPH